MPSSTSRFLASAIRALGFLDHDPTSPTAGCADRSYYHYQDGKSFAVGSFQVAMFGWRMASRQFPEQKELFFSASNMARDFWQRQVVELGLLDEYFAHQRSFCATAYSTLAATLCGRFDQLDNISPPPQFKAAIRRTLDELKRDPLRPTSANQSVAARLAWDLALESGLIDDAAENPFVIDQNAEGWLNEYGGFDLGYSLKCIDLMTLAVGVLSSVEARRYYAERLQHLLEFLGDVILNYTFAPSLGSRGNGHSLLGGLTVLARSGSQVSAALLKALSQTEYFALVTPETCDDKYLAFFHLTSQALISLTERPQPDFFSDAISIPEVRVPRAEEFKAYPSAGLTFWRLADQRLAVNSNRGGATHWQGSHGTRTFGGYLAKTGNELFTSYFCKVKTDMSELRGFWKIEISLNQAPIGHATTLIQNPWFSWALKLALQTPGLSNWVRRKIYRRAQEEKSSRPLGQRCIQISRQGFELVDRFSVRPEALYLFANWTPQDGHATRLFGLSSGHPFQKVDPEATFTFPDENVLRP